MAEATHGIRDLAMERVQSILDGESENDSQRSLPQVPDATKDATGLSSIQQNLSSSFNCLQRSIAKIDAEQLSPTYLHPQLAAYQNTVKDLYDQNKCNAELLGRLEMVVSEKESEISRLQVLANRKRSEN